MSFDGARVNLPRQAEAAAICLEVVTEGQHCQTKMWRSCGRYGNVV